MHKSFHISQPFPLGVTHFIYSFRKNTLSLLGQLIVHFARTQKHLRLKYRRSLREENSL